MRERLIELLHSIPPTRHKIVGRMVGKTFTTLSHIADYLLSHGIILPRCKVGDTIYRIRPRSNEIVSWVIVEIIITEDEIAYIDDSDNLIKDEDIGKTVFLTEAEATERMCHEQK